jgi:Family of unknown function (DUF6308)
MTSIGDRIHAFVDDGDAVRLLAKYYGGKYTGSRFDTARQLESADPHRFTAHDIAAVATLSVPLSGEAVAGLVDSDDQMAALLESVPTDVDLADASDSELETVFAVQRELDNITGIGHVTRSKLLAHKRPRLVPIRDQYVLTALVGRDYGPFTEPLRDALIEDSSIHERLDAVQRQARLSQPLSILRSLDVVIWMATHGDSQVPD